MSDDWAPFKKGDTISITVLNKTMKINGQNPDKWSGSGFSVDLPIDKELKGVVKSVGKDLVISVATPDGASTRAPSTRKEYWFPIIEKSNLEIVLIEKFIPVPQTAEQIADDEAYAAGSSVRAAAWRLENDLRAEQLTVARKIKADELKKFGPWEVINNNGDSILLNIGDTISIGTNGVGTIWKYREKKIKGQNIDRHSGGGFSKDLMPGVKWKGVVKRIEVDKLVMYDFLDRDLEYWFLLEDKKDFIITKKELTEAEFRLAYLPGEKEPDDICQLMNDNPIIYDKLKASDKGLPKKINMVSTKFKKNRKYQCKEGIAFSANLLRRFLGSKSRGGNKKSRKIYRTKTKRKKSRTSIKTHKLKKTSRRSRKSKN
jgi:hypothetical protein